MADKRNYSANIENLMKRTVCVCAGAIAPHTDQIFGKRKGNEQINMKA